MMILLSLGFFFLLLASGMPIAFAFGAATVTLIPFVVSPEVLINVPQRMVSSVDVFVLLAVPMYILSGTIMASGGVAKTMIDLAMLFVGRIRGGLGMTVITSTVLFSGISGSSSADTAAIGSITLPAMRKRGYPLPLATAIVAAGGATAVLIPPVIDLVLIGTIANISIAGLFAGALLPGLANCIAALVLTYFIARRLGLPTEPGLPWRDIARVLLRGIPAFGMAVIILGGILGGIFTPTEAGGVSIVYALLIEALIFRQLKIADLPKIISMSARITGIVFLMLAMGSAFGWVLNFLSIPQYVGELMTQIPNKFLFLMVVNIVFFFVGCFLETLPVLVILLPMLMPVVIRFGIHPIHFGILLEANLGLGFITPPVGVVLFTACSLSRLPLEPVVRPLLPYMIILGIMALLVTYWAGLSMFLPRLLGYA